MDIVQNIVGPLYGTDGSLVLNRASKDGAAVVTELHGKYYEQASRGRLFYGMSASAGIALIVAATTGGHPTLFNPLGSGINASIVRLYLAYASGTNAPTALAWAQTTNAGAAAATGSPILTATLVAANNGLIGSSNTSLAKWSPTTNTFTAAPTVIGGVGVGLTTMVSTSTNNPNALIVDYDGSLVVGQGAALSLVSIAATTTALFNVTVVWEEVPA